jgi:hypothetical protein
MNKQLLTTRVIWAAMVAGEIAFMFVVLIFGPTMNANSTVPTHRLTIIAGAMLVVLVPLAYFVRAGVYRSGRQENGRIAPGAYLIGNIIFWSMCEGVAFFGLLVTLLARKPGAAFAIAVVAMAVQAINFPTGGAIDES